MTIAKPQHHESAVQHVQGKAHYTDDFPEPIGTLHAALGLGPVEVGVITQMDFSAVKNAPGVVAVYTADDIPGENNSGPVSHDDPVLADGEIRYPQQPVLLVVATNRASARRAARLAKVVVSDRLSGDPSGDPSGGSSGDPSGNFSGGPSGGPSGDFSGDFSGGPSGDFSDGSSGDPIVTLDQAIAVQSRLHEDLVIVTGDADQAIETSPQKLEAQMYIGGQEHMYIEGQVAMVSFTSDGLHVLSSTQHPSEIQELIGHFLGLNSADITVEVRRMGGAFGGKESQAAVPALLSALAAFKLKQTVKLRLDRDEDMVTTGKRHDFRATMRAGFDEAGLIQGVKHTLSSRCGHSQDLSRAINDRAAFHCDNAYFYPSLKIESQRYRTNTVSNTAFRGFGGPQGMLAAERLLDKIAAFVDRDPLDVRLDNLYGQQGTQTPYGMHVDEAVLRPMMEKLAVDCDYRTRRAQVEHKNAQNPQIRRGIALTPVKFGISFTASFLNQAGALVHIFKDGSVQVNHGGTEMGQGLYTKIAAVAAESLGVPMGFIRVTSTRTDKVPNTSPTAASSGSDLNGMAVKVACDTIRARLVQRLEERFGATSQPIFADGIVKVADKELSFAEVVYDAWFNQVSLSATGYYATPGIGWDSQTGKGRPFFYFANGAACSEVEVNSLTGENRVLRTDILHDVGRSLNPEIDLGQIEGGFVQGQGWLTSEELVYDGKGVLKTHAPSTYKIPTATDRPDILKIELYDNENPEGTIYGSKAVGEPPLMLAISVHSALAHALSGLGPKGQWPDLNAPATAEEILRCLQQTQFLNTHCSLSDSKSDFR